MNSPPPQPHMAQSTRSSGMSTMRDSFRDRETRSFSGSQQQPSGMGGFSGSGSGRQSFQSTDVVRSNGLMMGAGDASSYKAAFAPDQPVRAQRDQPSDRGYGSSTSYGAGSRPVSGGNLRASAQQSSLPPAGAFSYGDAGLGTATRRGSRDNIPSSSLGRSGGGSAGPSRSSTTAISSARTSAGGRSNRERTSLW